MAFVSLHVERNHLNRVRLQIYGLGKVLGPLNVEQRATKNMMNS